MEILELLLTLHLLGAGITAVAVLAVFTILLRRKIRLYRGSAIILAALTGFQLVSGALLSVASADIHAVSAPVYCRNIGAYAGIIALVEFFLYRKMHQSVLPFPLRFAIAATSLGLFVAVLVGAIMYA